MKEALNILKSVANESSNPTARDECDLYGDLLASKLRTLPEKSRTMLMLEIDNLYIRYKFNCNPTQAHYPNVPFSHVPSALPQCSPAPSSSSLSTSMTDAEYALASSYSEESTFTNL